MKNFFKECKDLFFAYKSFSAAFSDSMLADLNFSDDFVWTELFITIQWDG